MFGRNKTVKSNEINYAARNTPTLPGIDLLLIDFSLLILYPSTIVYTHLWFKKTYFNNIVRRKFTCLKQCSMNESANTTQLLHCSKESMRN